MSCCICVNLSCGGRHAEAINTGDAYRPAVSCINKPWMWPCCNPLAVCPGWRPGRCDSGCCSGQRRCPASDGAAAASSTLPAGAARRYRRREVVHVVQRSLCAPKAPQGSWLPPKRTNAQGAHNGVTSRATAVQQRGRIDAAGQRTCFQLACCRCAELSWRLCGGIQSRALWWLSASIGGCCVLPQPVLFLQC